MLTYAPQGVEQHLLIDHLWILLLDDGFELSEDLDHTVAFTLQTRLPQPRCESFADPGFPIDQSAIAIEAQHLEPIEVRKSCLSTFDRRRPYRCAPFSS